MTTVATTKPNKRVKLKAFGREITVKISFDERGFPIPRNKEGDFVKALPSTLWDASKEATEKEKKDLDINRREYMIACKREGIYVIQDRLEKENRRIEIMQDDLDAFISGKISKFAKDRKRAKLMALLEAMDEEEKDLEEE